MAIFDLFKRQPRIVSLAELEDFLDSRAAYTAQKCVFEFSRASAGYVWQALFKEQTFLDMLERSRWQCYPLALADVGEVAFGVLRASERGDEVALSAGLQASIRRVMQRYAPPRGMTAASWEAAAGQVAGRIARASAAATRAVKDVSRLSATDVLAAMPIHEKIKGRDPEFVRNNFTMSLLGIHDELAKRADIEALRTVVIGMGRAQT